MKAQSIIIAIVYVLVFMLTVIVQIRAKMLTPFIILTGLVYFAFVALLIYDTLCLTTGGCSVWRWIRTALSILIPVVIVIMMLAMTYAKTHGNGTKSVPTCEKRDTLIPTQDPNGNMLHTTPEKDIVSCLSAGAVFFNGECADRTEYGIGEDDAERCKASCGFNYEFKGKPLCDENGVYSR